jgi:hypothetical protein
MRSNSPCGIGAVALTAGLAFTAAAAASVLEGKWSVQMPSYQRNGLFQLACGLARNMKIISPAGRRWQFQRIAPGALAHTRALLLLCGLASCAGSPRTLALQPDFEVKTPAGVASVSIRESPVGMTDEEFAQLVMAGMERAARGSVIAGRVGPPFPFQRIVWHVNLSAQRGVSRLVVNVFDGASPYAYEQDTISNGSPAAVITSVVESMSKRLLADVAGQAKKPNE